MRTAFLLALIILVSAACSASAAHETVQIGPFNLSFDMNTSEKYGIQSEGPSYGMTPGGVKFARYNLSISSKDSFMFVVLTSYNGSMLASVNADMGIVRGVLRAAGCEPDLYTVMLGDERDGHRCVVGTCKFPSGHIFVGASFSPDASLQGREYRGRTNFRILSSYPWEVTRDMLNGLRVEVAG
jgi:hypothetical protein